MDNKKLRFAREVNEKRAQISLASSARGASAKNDVVAEVRAQTQHLVD
jgi:hypothetical protein